MGNIVLQSWQDRIIVDALRASNTDGSGDEALRQYFIDVAKVSAEIADAYLRSWRFNHCTTASSGAIEVVLRKLDAEDKMNLSITSSERKVSTGVGIVAQIISLYVAGNSVHDIIAQGYNKNTVYRQVAEYKKRMSK